MPNRRPEPSQKPPRATSPPPKPSPKSLSNAAAKNPPLPHITLYIDDHTTRIITCGELLSRAERVAAELTRRGLHAGDTVALMLPTGAEFFFCFAGIWLAGGIPVPMYPPFRADRIEEYALRQAAILRNAEAKFLITFRQVSSLAKILHTRVPSLQAVLDATTLSESAASSSPPDTETRPTVHHFHPARPSDIAFLQYTSGSTGDPKGVILTHANLLANIRAIGNAVDLRADDVAVSWLPLYHDMGLIGAWFVPLCFGIPLISMSPLAFLTRPVRWLRAISTHRGTLSPAPNFAYELCTRKIDDRDLRRHRPKFLARRSQWRRARSAETLQRFADRFAKHGFHASALFPVYGLAEASLCVSAPRIGSGCKVDRIERHAFETQGRAIPVNDGAPSLDFVSSGMPIADVEIKIVDPEGRELPERTQGRLWFRGASATQGYYRNPGATAALRVRPPGAPALSENDWLDSGDLAYLADGELYITGRAKDMIIKAGRNLYPHEMEEIAGRTHGVRTGCVVAFGAPDPKNGTERFIVAAEVRNKSKSNGQSRNTDESSRIISDIRRAITEAAGIPPDHIVLLGPNSIPKTSSGKLRRAETRRLFLTGELGRKTAPWIQIARLAILGIPARTTRALRHAAKSTFQFLYGAYTLAIAALFIVPCWLALLFTRNPRTASRIERAAARAMLACAFIRVTLSGDPTLLSPLPPLGSSPLTTPPTPTSFSSSPCSPPAPASSPKAKPSTCPSSAPSSLAPHTSPSTAAIPRPASAKPIPSATPSSATTPSPSSPKAPSLLFPGIRPFQLGTFKSAAETHTPICPISIRGARLLLRDKTWLPRHTPVSITVGPLLTPHTHPPDAETSWQEICPPPRRHPRNHRL